MRILQILSCPVIFFTALYLRATAPLLYLIGFDASRFGKSVFYAPPEIIKDVEKAIDQLIKSEDISIYSSLTNGHRFCFYYDVKNRNSCAPTGIFTLPKSFVDGGPEGIAQYLVFCVIVREYCGTSYASYIDKVIHNNDIYQIPKKEMVKWLLDHAYSQKWINVYETNGDVQKSKGDRHE